MTFGQESPDGGGAPALWPRLRPARHVLVASALVLLLLVLAGALAPVPALAAGAVILAAALWGSRVGSAAAARLQSRGTAPAPDVRGAGPPVGELIVDIIAGLPDPVLALDRDGVVIAANAAAHAVIPALRRSEPISLALRMPAIIDAIRRAGATGAPQRAEFSARVPVDRWFEAHVIPISMRTGRGRGLLLLTLHDLTPLRRVEEMRADFVANASHELRTPLAALSGFIDTLQGAARDDTAARERFLAIMKEQASRMARLIEDLLSLSRVELNAHIQPETPLELAPIVRQVVDGLQMLAQERGVEITISGTQPLRVCGERDELIRLFENLVENALKYGGAGKRVDIILERPSASDEAGEARVSVRDYGPGIAPEHLPRLTERFYRVDVGHSRAEGGTGLGLALVKHILNRHRGRLLIASQPGEGASFTVCLPLVEGQSSVS